MQQFKNKSRFSILVEDSPKITQVEQKQIYVQPENKTTNYFKKEYNEKNYSKMSNSEYIRTKEKEELIQKASEMKRIEKERIETLSSNNFPDLISNKISCHTQKVQNMTFVNKVKPYILPVKKSNVIDSDINEIIEPGWLQIFKDSETNKIIMKYNENDYKENTSYKQDKIKVDHKVDVEVEEKIIIHNTMIALVDLHKRRTEEYIELWGKDEWERYFLFSNDDYNYNDSDDEYEDFDTEIENYDDYYDNDEID